MSDVDGGYQVINRAATTAVTVGYGTKVQNGIIVLVLNVVRNQSKM